MNDLKKQVLDFYDKHETRVDVAFFVGGFVFDVLLLSDVDDLFGLAQQFLYLFIIGFLLNYEILFRLHKWRPTGNFITKFWAYRSLILHFSLGSLLNMYSLFYIKSSSFISSVVFLFLMVALIVGNELPIVKKSKVSFKVGLFAICLFSCLSILYPLILGFVGWTPFFLAVVTTLGVFYFQVCFLKRKFPDDKTAFNAVLYPGLSVVLVFAIFYVLGWIPPVPLSVKSQGIYHAVEKRNGQYFLSTERDWWKFWQSGDQDFKARPQDKIYFYAQVYSPTRFADKIFIQWLWKNPKTGWQKTDRIPLNIVGGRKEGFRGFAVKSNYQPGDWSVRIETEMGHEISRLSFEVIPDSGTEPRNFQVLVQ